MGCRWEKAVFLVFAAISLLCVWGVQSWAEEGKDHPLIKRFPDARIYSHIRKDFEEVILPLGKAKGDVFEKAMRIEGKLTAISYVVDEHSVLEVYRNYEIALKKGGFEFLFTCADNTCGRGGSKSKYLEYVWDCSEMRQLTAKLPRQEGDVFIDLHVCGWGSQTMIYQTVIEARPMQTGLIKVDADALANDIKRTGHASVYGIYFDTNKAEVKPESEAALAQISKLLKQRPDLKLYVVGHTDNVGKLAYNKDLSMRRAKAVVEVLTKKYGIASERLQSDGVGPLAPVASNNSEDGRGKNRRVELVAR
ncbi:MAG: OmpA family protein [bacterium]